MLAVPDVMAAAEFYRDQLGFDVRLIWGDPPFYSIVVRDGFAIDFIKSDTASGNAGDRGGIYVNVEGVDEIYEELKAREVVIWDPPEDKEYGMRDFIALDLNGYRLCFGQNAEEARAL